MPESFFERVYNAILENNLKALEDFVSSGYDLNTQFEVNGLTPLHLAAWHNRPMIISYLIDHGAKVDQTERLSRKSPLHIAAYFGNFDCCRVLIEKNASTNPQDYAYYTPLHYAVMQGHLELAKFLNEAGGDLFISSVCGTALDIAIRHEDIEMVDYLTTKLSKHLSLKSPKNPLMKGFWKHAFSYNEFDLRNALHFAVLLRSEKIVRLLLERKCLPMSVDVHTCTPLHLAAEKGYSEIVKLLLSTLGYVKEEDLYHFSPLELAMINGHSSTVDVFVDKGAKPWMIDKVQLFGERPTSTVSAAVWDGNYQQLKEILEHEGKGVLFEKDDKDGDPPLQRAIQCSQTAIAKLFIEYGGKELIMQRERYQMTALHRAAFHGNLDLYQLMFHIGGAELLKQTCETFGTPLDCALSNNHLEIVKWTLGQLHPDFSFEELFCTERDNWALMDINPQIGAYFTQMQKELASAVKAG